MSTAFLGLGSNLGDRAANLVRAIGLLTKQGLHITKASSIYETEPVDIPSESINQPLFLNMVVAASSPQIDPYSLMSDCLLIEKQLGRTRLIDLARTIDIDLLLFDDLIIDGSRGETRLVLPHPRIEFRRFVLEPFAEIAPEIVHPVKRVTISQLLAAVTDNSSVKIYGS